MTNIQEVKMFKCPETGKLFKSAKEAEKSAVKERARKEADRLAAEQAKISEEDRLKAADYIRLNLADVRDLSSMLVTEAKKYNVEIKDLKINVSFGNVSNSHGAPIGQQTNWSRQDESKPFSYLGWSGNISAIVSKPNLTRDSRDSASDILFGRWGNFLFRGFHTSSGCPGSAISEYRMSIGFYFFLDDFPLLKAKYEKYQEELNKAKANETNKFNWLETAYREASKYSEIIEIDEKIKHFQSLRNEALKANLANWKANNPLKLEEIAPDFEKDKEMFESFRFNV